MPIRLDRSATRAGLRLFLSTAVGAALLAGCTTGTPRPEKFAAGAQTALAKGRLDNAASLAEQAVAADPRNPAYRVLLGNVYLRAGRFESARQALDEAMELGEDSGKSALALALADTALGKGAEALDTLTSYRDLIPAVDYGLALALAGQAPQGIAVLTEALRTGEVTPKLRQNLALAYALGGHWREARVMAALDVPAAELDERMTQWAVMAKPQDAHQRVAALLGVPVRVDSGFPAHLALANFPDAAQHAAVAAAAAEPAPALAVAAEQELAAIDTPAATVSAAADAPLAAIDIAPAEQAATPRPALVAMESVPVVQPVPASRPRAVRRVATPASPATITAAGTYAVQLGSFTSAEGARRASRHFTTRNPHLAGYRNVTTQVTVNGRQFWRVQAAGLAAGQAFSMCRSIKAKGGACLVMAPPRDAVPQPGRVDTRLARRR